MGTTRTSVGRLVAGPLLPVPIPVAWSRVWIGAWAVVPGALALLGTWANPDVTLRVGPALFGATLMCIAKSRYRDRVV